MSINKVRAPCDGYFSITSGAQATQQQKDEKPYFNHINGESLQWACWKITGSQYFKRHWKFHGAGLEIPGVGWQYFRELRRWLGTIHGTATSVREIQEEHWLLTSEVLINWWRLWDIWRLLKIFVWRLHWFRLTTTPQRDLRQREETIGLRPKSIQYICPDTDVCWRRLVGAHVGSGYLVWDRRQLRMLMLWSISHHCTYLVAK